ncbi:MAG: PBECR4 domain-containing protein [Bacillota bacterium]
MIKDKDDARKVILNASKKYAELLGKDFFVIAERSNSYKWTEVAFCEKNFLHLTGVKFFQKTQEDNALTFFDKALNNKLANSDFEIVNDLTYKKLSVLENACNFTQSGKMHGNFDGQKRYLKTGALVGTVSWYLGFVYDEDEKSMLPNTLMKEDIRDVSEPFGIIMMIEKTRMVDLKYELDNIVYINNKRFDVNNIKNLPKEIKNKIEF